MIRYVGKTNRSLAVRLGAHLLDPKVNHKTCWIKSLRALGLKPTIEAIEEFHDIEDEVWIESERFWIEYFRTLGFKLTNGDSGGNSGKRATLETRRKQSEKKQNMPESTRKKISEANRARPPEVRARFSYICAHPTAETRRKMSESAKRRPPPTRQAIEKTAAWNRGRKRPKEWCDAIKAGSKNKTPEYRAKLSRIKLEFYKQKRLALSREQKVQQNENQNQTRRYRQESFRF